MNELRLKAILSRFKNLVEELETEIKSDPGHYKMSDEDYEQLKIFYQHEQDDDGYPD